MTKIALLIRACRQIAGSPPPRTGLPGECRQARDWVAQKLASYGVSSE